MADLIRNWILIANNYYLPPLHGMNGLTRLRVALRAIMCHSAERQQIRSAAPCAHLPIYFNEALNYPVT